MRDLSRTAVRIAVSSLRRTSTFSCREQWLQSSLQGV